METTNAVQTNHMPLDIDRALAQVTALSSTLALLRHTGETLNALSLLAAFNKGRAAQLPAGDAPALSLSEIFCLAAGSVQAAKKAFTQNQICDSATQLICCHPHWAQDPTPETVRSVTLPVYSRLVRDGHSDDIALQQSLLHILAWRSKSHWAQDQAQRLLWKGGVLGEGGRRALEALDEALIARKFTLDGLADLLFITALLARLPRGPIFSDATA